MPLYHWRSLAELKLPKGCSLVGIEILDEAQDLPSFPHPVRAAYVLGRNAARLAPSLPRVASTCVRIPAAFSLNVATAGAIVMYDRLRSLGRFASRPVAERAEPPRAGASCAGRAAQTDPAGLTRPCSQRKIKPVCCEHCSRIGDPRDAPSRSSCLRRRGTGRDARMAQEVTLLEKFKDWSAYAATGSPKVCFAVAKPTSSSPKNVKRGPIFFYISQWPADKVVNEISVKMGYPFGPGAKATVTIGTRQVRVVHQGRRGLRREAGDGDQADRGDEDRQHDEDRREVGARHRHQRRLFAERPVRCAGPRRQGMRRLSCRTSCRRFVLASDIGHR